MQIDNDAIIIGYIGRILYMKGLDLLVDAFVKSCNELPEKKLVFFLVGSGEYEAEFTKLLSSKGIESDIRRLPSVPQHEVPAYMRMIDILVLPSRRIGMWTEQFGRVLIEAMASRTIVIGSSSGAIPEVIGDVGFIFEENDADDLHRKLREVILMNSEEKKMLLDRGEQRAHEQFSWKRFAEESIDALRFVYNRSRKR
jgi:glycosyltransferase involved in cell wall biosynthesis